MLKSLSEQARRIEDESMLDVGAIRLLEFPIKETKVKKMRIFNWNNFHTFRLLGIRINRTKAKSLINVVIINYRGKKEIREKESNT